MPGFWMNDDEGELPDGAFIPARIVLDDEAFDRVVDLLESPPTPTHALRELMRRTSPSSSGTSSVWQR